MAANEVVVAITGNTAKLEASLGRATGGLSKFASGAASIGKLIGGAFAVTAIAQFAKEAIDLGDEMATLADRMGTSVETLSRLQYVAEQSNSSFDALRTSMDQLAKGLSKAEDGGGRARKSLADLGIEAEKLTSLSVDQQLGVIADAFARIERPADQTRIAMELFGGAGAEMLPILRLGSAGIRQLGDEAERLGAVLSTDAAKSLQDTDEALKRVAASTRTFKAELVALVATPVSKFIDGLGVSMKMLRERFMPGDSPIAQLQRDLAKVNDLIDSAGPFQDTSKLEAAREQLKKLVYAYEEAAQAQLRLDKAQMAGAAGKAIPTLDEVKVTHSFKAERDAAIERLQITVESQRMQKSAMEQYFEDLDRATQTSIESQVEQYEEFKSKLDVLFSAGKIDTTQYNERLKEALDEVLEPVEVTSQRIQSASEQVSEFALQAARNMQDAFANFLFDPFDQGIKGMLRGFIDVIRRMVAEAAAAKIFDFLKGGSGGGAGGFLGKLLGGLFKADGGPVERGRSYVVGERGPELFTPGASGMITPNSRLATAGASISIVNNVDARGSSISRAELEASMRQTSDVTIARVREMVGAGRI